MNWSDYSRFVGDIFGAPLAIEALRRVLPRVHLPRPVDLRLGPAAQAAAPGQHLGRRDRHQPVGAYFILAANSFMQNPVGYRINPTPAAPSSPTSSAVLTNKVALITFPHTLAGVVPGRRRRWSSPSACWHLIRNRDSADTDAYRFAAKFGSWVVAGLRRRWSLLTGDIQGKIMTEVQPMKMAAAEALYTTEQPAPVLRPHRRQPRRQPRGLRPRDPRPAVVPRHRRPRTAPCRASTTCRPSTPASTAPAATPRSSRSPTGASAS